MELRWAAACVLCALLATTTGETNLPPEFRKDMNNLAVSELTPPGTVVYRLQGSDPEGGPIKYGLVGTDKFSVDPETGDVTLVKPLDKESEETIKFLVSIEDAVPGSSNNLVQVPAAVIVLDENDNAPQFLNGPYEVDVPEDEAVGRTILHDILVEDKDSVGDNLEVTCVANQQWSSACDMFELVALQSSSHRYSGALVLRRPLDYEQQQYYQFQLTASDGSLNSSVHVEVKVVDVQNRPPVFSGSLNAALAEDAAVGTLALTVRARDGDRAVPRNVVVELVNNPLDFFLLNQETGELKTAKPLDREALPDPSSPLNLTVRATEVVNGQPYISNQTSSLATVTITIKDVNDEPPRFSQKEYHVSVPESLPPHTPLPRLDMLVTDTDVGLNSVFFVRVAGSEHRFVAEPGRGAGGAAGSARAQLRLNSSLDYEDPNQRKFILEVIAEELHTSPALHSSASVIVTVTDVNDNAPQFADDDVTVVVSETAPPGVIANITATDRDSGRFGTSGLVYQLWGAGSELFTVEPRTGAVSVAPCARPGHAPCLDHEAQKDYFLHYKATDDDGAGQSTVISLHVRVTDGNDNPPVFATPVYRASIDEDAVKFEPELQVQARDVDETSEIRYSIVSPEDSPFWVDLLTGRLGVRPDQRVAVEGDHNKIVLTVMASDGVFNATCEVEISVRDVNNHAPAFDAANYTALVSEDTPIGTSIASVSAHDLDSGVNSELVLALRRGAHHAFSLDDDGTVRVADRLDYDVRDTYHVIIEAADKGMPSLTGTTELTINVINVNDKKPSFTPPIQRAEVSADAEVGTFVHNLVAVDPDTTSIEDLKYELATDRQIIAVDNNGKEVSDEGIFGGWFSVSPNGSVWVSRAPDRARAAVVTLPVAVTDTAAPSVQRADGELIITIVDVNRHAPQFSQAVYRETVVEEQPAGTALNTYAPRDQDTGIAAVVIDPPSPYFVIDNVTGLVKTAQRIDYEKLQHINFTLIAYDSGVPQRSSSAEVLVSVVNANDEDPVFTAASYEGVVRENSDVGTPVLIVMAKDADLGEFGEVSYHLSGNQSSLFSIDSSGAITVAAPIDRELTSDIYLRVVAEDQAPKDIRRSSTAPIHIKVLDENDNAPAFTQQVYRATIAENLRVSPPAAILQLLAEDKDEGAAGTVTYRIEDQSEAGVFTVDESTGILYPAKPVTGDRSYEVTVSASDGAHSVAAAVHVSVTRVNKHSPVILQPPPMLEVKPEQAQPDSLLTTVQATDADGGDNGRVSYFLRLDDRNVAETPEFTLDQLTGELRARVALDREHGPYQLVLVASDHGSPARFETLRVVSLTVAGGDEHAPAFPQTSYELIVPENLPPGVIVGSLKATDKDAGAHGTVYYHILEGNHDGAFTLDRTQGLLRTNATFDREQQSEYTLTVYASNNPILERAAAILNSIDKHENGSELAGAASVAAVRVRVMDENDNAPRFLNKVYYAGVKHTAKINEAITSVIAIDEDFAENGTLMYLVAASNLYKFGESTPAGSIVPSPFNITQEGVLMTATFMAEYRGDRFVLDVLAQEVAPPHRRAVAQVYVWVLDSSSLIRMVVSRSCVSVGAPALGAGGTGGAAAGGQGVVTSRLGAAANALLVPVHAKHYVHSDTLYQDWCEVHLQAVDPGSLQLLPAPAVLRRIDAQYDALRDLYQEYGVETLIANSDDSKGPASFDPALAALIALLLVLFTGVVTFVVVCACLKHWVISPPSLQSSKGDSLARRRILEELATTENPLWLESKLRPYEEQELSMNVFADQLADQLADTLPDATVDNTYATIQTRRLGDYATLGEDSPTGFQGSTFKPPTPTTPEPPPRPSAMHSP
ncbi:cadherin-87A isoform X1 [Plutella xylostella]|uniref:cadherin-87A isoform X1 n=1 Tax=Plutella xylostella TaxID=51655 RepID=UPI00203225BF|nr:cadherin-87A isoform X1 [Plutella xylostella]XP_048477677.1 cadherin-87A isoform X1 [Plutella xylostella]